MYPLLLLFSGSIFHRSDVGLDFSEHGSLIFPVVRNAIDYAAPNNRCVGPFSDNRRNMFWPRDSETHSEWNLPAGELLRISHQAESIPLDLLTRSRHPEDRD